MNILFVHQNFPGQYKHLAPALARNPLNRVVAMRLGVDTFWQGIQVIGYQVPPQAGAVHLYLSDLQVKVIRAEAVAARALLLKKDGFIPDIILAHPGWGETLFLKQIWPTARVGLFCEFFYGVQGTDVDFDPEFPSRLEPLPEACRLQMKNANQLLAFESADRGLSPTQWQKGRYPQRLADAIDVIHDGIDTQALRANPDVSMQLNGQRTLTRTDEIITFVSRNLEPYRGYHQFLRALPDILKQRPNARVMIVGGDSVSYGAAPPNGKTWRALFWDEVKDRLDTSRVHFVGHLPYEQFVQLLQLSTVHVYLTYPFVLSWSLLEAMSMQCAIVASSTAPVIEVLEHKTTALLVDFFKPDELTAAVCRLLEDKDLSAHLGQAARKRVVSDFDLQTVCLPGQIEWVSRLARQSL